MPWFSSLVLLVCFQGCISALTQEIRTYYEYVPSPMQLNEAQEHCKKRSGALATFSNQEELTSIINSLNISQPVWVVRKDTTHLTIPDLLSHSFRGKSISQNATVTVTVIHISESCDFFNPVIKNWEQDKCDSVRGAVCQFKKVFEVVLDVPTTPFFSRMNKDLLTKPVKEDLTSTTYAVFLTWLQQLTQSVLYLLESEGLDLLTPSDVLYLSQKTGIDLTAMGNTKSVGSDAADIMVSIVTNYMRVASFLLEPHMVTQWIGWTEDGVSVGPFTIIKSIDYLTEALADILSAKRRNFTLSTKNIDVYITWQKLSEKSCSQVFKPSVLGSQTSSSNDWDELLIPDTELERIHTMGYDEVMFIHTHYSHLSKIVFGKPASPLSHQEKPERIHQAHLASAVISATIRDPSKAQIIPVAVQYTLSSSNVVEYSPQVSPVCAFWNFSLMQNHSSGWSSDGCRVTFSGSGTTSCQCNHTTNFAVLMNYQEAKWSTEEELILTKLTFIGAGASLCALVVTLMLFTVLGIPKSDRMSIHKNLFIALICAQVILLCSSSAIHNKVACTLVAALLHLFFMAAFSWMLVEGLLLWSKVVAVNLSEERHMKYYYLIGWGLPVLIVTITLASASGKYSADSYCWLSVQNGVIWGFAGPVIFIIMVNILVLTRVLIITISTAKRRSIMLAIDASPVEQAYEQIRAAVKAVLVLLPILGVTWLCGVLVPFSIAMAYIFILLNSLQGLFIFLIYGVYNTEVRSTVNRIKERRKALNFSNCASSRPSSSVTSSCRASFPPGATMSQEEETTSTYTGGNMPVLGNEEERARGQLPIPGVPEKLENLLIQTSKGIHGHQKEPPSLEVDSRSAGCSLHVPVELEFTASCIPRSPMPQKSYDLVCVD
ncbi:adhesion G-protein coupled receptor D2 isoform X4 [Channa argus]|uniref:adhesion G-protein coupled receptor D2 isoform X4 n=1 Tax=Channa argus TaxID=215402 RepID=UPI0035229956